jgi:hypothetical protein
MGIFGGGNSSSNTWPTFTGVQLNVAVNTMPIPILWGAGKLGTNLIEYVDFSGHKESSGGKGGKGGTTDYTATLELALCEGLVDSVPLVLVNTNQQQTLSQLKMTLIPGTYPEQDPWSYMVSAHPGDAYGYPGTAIIAVENYDLGESASVPNQNMLVVRQCLSTQGDNYFQAPWCLPNAIQSTTYPIVATRVFDLGRHPDRRHGAGDPGHADERAIWRAVLSVRLDRYRKPAVAGQPADPRYERPRHLDTSGNPIVNVPADGDFASDLSAGARYRHGAGSGQRRDGIVHSRSLDAGLQLRGGWGTNAKRLRAQIRALWRRDDFRERRCLCAEPFDVIYDLDDDDYLGDSPHRIPSRSRGRISTTPTMSCAWR